MTFTQSAVQATLHPAIEILLEQKPVAGRQPLKGFAPAASFAVVGDAVSFKPLFLILLPLASHTVRDRVGKPKRHKVRAAILPPVRQIPLVHAHRPTLIERHEARRP